MAAGVKLYVTHEGQLIESDNAEEGLIYLGTISSKIGDNRILGVNTREEYIFIGVVKLMVAVLAMLSFTKFMINTRI